MAKARNYFGLRTGSTKSKTFSILNGWQIEKDRVYGGKNPRTNAQMRQRMVMATASAAYSGMREIVDHSFEGVTYGQPTMSKFISENAKMLLKGNNGTDFVYNDYQYRGCLPNPYLVSKGSVNHNLTYEVSEFLDSVVNVQLLYAIIDPLTMTVASSSRVRRLSAKLPNRHLSGRSVRNCQLLLSLRIISRPSNMIIRSAI